jgi:hypothetical protein
MYTILYSNVETFKTVTVSRKLFSNFLTDKIHNLMVCDNKSFFIIS